MTVILEQINVPESGVVRIHVDQTAEIRISAAEAQKVARRWVREYVSMMMSADRPTLTLAENIVWRVPITFATTHLGTVGKVGTIDVDVQTGQIIDTTEHQQAMLIATAQAISSRLPPYQPRQAMPADVISSDLPRSPSLQLPED